MAEENGTPNTSALSPTQSRPNAIEMTARGFTLSNIDDAWRFAQFVIKSGLAPKNFEGKPEAILIAIQMGAELGLPPMASLQNIAVINGRPSLWGDCALAIVQAHPQYEWHKEFFEGEGDARAAVFQIKRKGHEVHEVRFSLADGKRAGLTNKKDTPWQTYPERMMQWRARGWGMRDKFADALRGMITAEEAGDYPGVTINSRHIEQDDSEKELRDQADAILKAKGFNDAQRTIRLTKNAGKMAEYVESLKSEENPPTQKAEEVKETSANSSTPEGQGSVTPSNSRDVGTHSEPEKAPRESETQPSGLFDSPPSKPTSAQSPKSSASTSAAQKNGGGHARRFTF